MTYMALASSFGFGLEVTIWTIELTNFFFCRIPILCRWLLYYHTSVGNIRRPHAGKAAVRACDHNHPLGHALLYSEILIFDEEYVLTIDGVKLSQFRVAGWILAPEVSLLHRFTNSSAKRQTVCCNGFQDRVCTCSKHLAATSFLSSVSSFIFRIAPATVFAGT